MLRIDKKGKRLVGVQKSSLSAADQWERELEDMIWASPQVFCDELGQKLWMIGREVRPSDAVPDRMDLLAIDEEGSGVVIELKRGSNKLQLLQAISYAGMLRDGTQRTLWKPSHNTEAKPPTMRGQKSKNTSHPGWPL